MSLDLVELRSAPEWRKIVARVAHLVDPVAEDPPAQRATVDQVLTFFLARKKATIDDCFITVSDPCWRLSLREDTRELVRLGVLVRTGRSRVDKYGRKHALYALNEVRVRRYLDHFAFCDALRILRLRDDRTPSEIADILGVTVATLIAWERGTRRPRRRHFECLCELFPALARYTWTAKSIALAPPVASMLSATPQAAIVPTPPGPEPLPDSVGLHDDRALSPIERAARAWGLAATGRGPKGKPS
jgi:transcriptional regulator with XRE-family HTH domain